MKAEDEERAILAEIAELKRRWPGHSVPAGMWQELEELEERLEEVRGRGDDADDGSDDRPGSASHD